MVPRNGLTCVDVRHHQIGLAVRSIQWSYAIFWSVSLSSQPGVLKWGDGLYNGEMKSKSKAQQQQKQQQSDEETYSQRSEQLRELFKSLAAASEESNPQSKKQLPSVISPEDLTQSEWFYLVCMSFVFNPGQELPGKAFAKGQPVWLCNAHLADNKVFGRSLLAKSASIKTVACFPVPGGVVELGVTEKVPDDAGLIQCITEYLRDKSVVLKGSDLTAQRPSSSTDHVTTALVDISDTQLVAPTVSPHTSTTEFGLADSFIVDSIHEEAAHLQSWQFIDEDDDDEDDLNDYVHYPGNSIDSSISKMALHPGKMAFVSTKTDHQCILETQECNDQMNDTTRGLIDDEMHYQSVISAILHTSVMGPQYGNTIKASSFVSYGKGRLVGIMRSDKSATPHQRMLKNVLTQVPKMYREGPIGAPETLEDRNVVQKECEDTACLPEAEDVILAEAENTGLNHVLAERRRREKLKRRFLVLRSLVPTTAKVDKISILDDTIKYLKAQERRIEELESAKDITTDTLMVTKEAQDTNERTSDNYELEETATPSKKRRKARHADENNIDCVSSKHKYNDELLVELVEEKGVRIELECPWRKRLLPELMEALSNLNLECISAQTCSTNGILSLKLSFKLQGLNNIASTKMIKQEIRRIVNK